jgi:hypothetical protein
MFKSNIPFLSKLFVVVGILFISMHSSQALASSHPVQCDIRMDTFGYPYLQLGRSYKSQSFLTNDGVYAELARRNNIHCGIVVKPCWIETCALNNFCHFIVRGIDANRYERVSISSTLKSTKDFLGKLINIGYCQSLR